MTPDKNLWGESSERRRDTIADPVNPQFLLRSLKYNPPTMSVGIEEVLLFKEEMGH